MSGMHSTVWMWVIVLLFSFFFGFFMEREFHTFPIFLTYNSNFLRMRAEGTSFTRAFIPILIKTADLFPLRLQATSILNEVLRALNGWPSNHNFWRNNRKRDSFLCLKLYNNFSWVSMPSKLLWVVNLIIYFCFQEVWTNCCSRWR